MSVIPQGGHILLELGKDFQHGHMYGTPKKVPVSCNMAMGWSKSQTNTKFQCISTFK